LKKIRWQRLTLEELGAHVGLHEYRLGSPDERSRDCRVLDEEGGRIMTGWWEEVVVSPWSDEVVCFEGDLLKVEPVVRSWAGAVRLTGLVQLDWLTAGNEGREMF
jgi:hypothetical protein